MAETTINQQHLDKLQSIAAYEQWLNVSPEERIVEMNYPAVHWQAKDGVTPRQIEAVYNEINPLTRIGFERANTMQQQVGNPPVLADEYYTALKNTAYVSTCEFGDKNSIDTQSIRAALEEIPVEYVIERMTPEQLDLFADYYSSSLDYSPLGSFPFSSAETKLYETIINTKQNERQSVHTANLNQGESSPQHKIKFVWNGIKIDGHLYKGKYSIGPYTEASALPKGTVTIYMDTSRTPRNCGLEVKNESDIMTDYFESDTVIVRTDSAYYPEAASAATAYDIHMEKAAVKQYEKAFAKHLGTNLEEFYANELARLRMKLSDLEKKSGKDKSVRKNTVPQR